jgi:hypothetical protein
LPSAPSDIDNRQQQLLQQEQQQGVAERTQVLAQAEEQEQRAVLHPCQQLQQIKQALGFGVDIDTHTSGISKGLASSNSVASSSAQEATGSNHGATSVRRQQRLCVLQLAQAATRCSDRLQVSEAG